MNKKTKGLVTAAVGASLLLGSAGTFALWYDTAAIQDGGVETGDLYLNNITIDGWTFSETLSHIAEGEEANVLVPGDTATTEITESFFGLAGDSILARFSVTGINSDLLDGAPLTLGIAFSDAEIGIDFSRTLTADEIVAYADATTGDVLFSLVLDETAVTWFNSSISEENPVTLTLSFPQYRTVARQLLDEDDELVFEADGTTPVRRTDDRAFFWGTPKDAGTGRNASIELEGNVFLDFVQIDGSAIASDLYTPDRG